MAEWSVGDLIVDSQGGGVVEVLRVLDNGEHGVSYYVASDRGRGWIDPARLVRRAKARCDEEGHSEPECCFCFKDRP